MTPPSHPHPVNPQASTGLPPGAAILRRVPMPKGPLGATNVCVLAIGLISAASANVVYGMQGGAMDAARALWTLAGFTGGGGLIYAFKCHTMLHAHAPPREPPLGGA